jgi:hypothetical protein
MLMLRGRDYVDAPWDLRSNGGTTSKMGTQPNGALFQHKSVASCFAAPSAGKSGRTAPLKRVSAQARLKPCCRDPLSDARAIGLQLPSTAAAFASQVRFLHPSGVTLRKPWFAELPLGPAKWSISFSEWCD